MILKVISWNIWILGNFDQITEFLTRENADIICLQEVKDNDPTRNILDYLEKAGYQKAYQVLEGVWEDKNFRVGPAIFSKFPIVATQTYNLSENDNRIAIQADISLEGKTLHVFSTHLTHTHQKESEIQNEQAENLLKEVPQTLSIVAGDFNATPDSSAIKIMQTRLVNSDPVGKPTWSVYKEGCSTCNTDELNYKLDHIFTTPDIKVKSFEVGNSKASDHLPIIATIEI